MAFTHVTLNSDTMYDGDSFFTLSLIGQIGLVAVSTAFGLLVLVLTRFISKARIWILRCAAWAVLFTCFVWLSPQGYYAYYLIIFDALPVQWVIRAPPHPKELLNLMLFRSHATMSAHSVGMLGWIMLVVAVWPQRRNCRDAAN